MHLCFSSHFLDIKKERLKKKMSVYILCSFFLVDWMRHSFLSQRDDSKELKKNIGFRVLSYFWKGKEVNGHKVGLLSLRNDFGGKNTLSCIPPEGRWRNSSPVLCHIGRKRLSLAAKVVAETLPRYPRGGPFCCV